MKAEEYYKSVESKWQNEYPSPKSLDDIWSFYKECGYKNPQATIAGLLNKVEWQKNRVLDFGCDTGLMLGFICDKYPSVAGVGIDINLTAIERARRNFPEKKFETFDGMNLPFEDKSFDLVFVCAVIKHVRYEDREHVYGELRRVADRALFIEADARNKESISHESWTFYNSNFEKEFRQNFEPIEVVREAGDILGLFACN